MNVKMLNKLERMETRTLWEEVFQEDGRAFLDYYYDCVVAQNQIYGIEVDGSIRSMVHLNSYEVRISEKQKNIHYIVAVSTQGAYRRKGYMGELLRASMVDMYDEGEPFTFLMPAAESIYSPYDFITISEQIHYQYEDRVCKVSLPIIPGYECAYATKENCEELADFATKIFLKKYKISTVRSGAYYERLLKEQQCQNGGIVLIKNEDCLVGYFLMTREKDVQVREIVVAPGEEKLIDKLQLKTIENPKIMVRIICVISLIECLRTNKVFETTMEIFDPIISENIGVFLVKGDGENISCVKISSIIIPEKAMHIRELTSMIFIEEERQNMKAFKSRVSCLQPVLLNEIV